MGGFGSMNYVCVIIISIGFIWLEKAEGSKSCNVYEGKWEYDESYPLYNSTGCPRLRKEFDCLKYGRPDRRYLKYSWHPNSCQLPRFDGEDFLRRVKGKKIMFIGDSISLNHWQSLVCLLHSAVPLSNFTQDSNQSLTTVQFQKYNVSVMLLKSPYLVDIEVEEIGRVLKLDSLKNGIMWKQMDILIFNSWLWWNRRGLDQPWDYLQEGEKIFVDMDREVAFEKALKTWAKWVDSDIDPQKTTVFFRGISPSHYNGVEWNEPGVNDCSKETMPIGGTTYHGGVPQVNSVVEEVLSGIKKPVHYLNITTLSQLRKDAHPSTYNGDGRMDCTHWCVAGLPDTWNQLIYTTILQATGETPTTI